MLGMTGTLSPPSTPNTWPVIQPASSLARNTMLFPISAGVPARPSGAAVLLHDEARVLEAERRARDVEAQAEIPGLGTRLEDGAGKSAPRVGDEHVEVSAASRDLDGVSDLLFVGDVAADCRDVEALGRKLLRRFPQHIEAPPRDRDPCPDGGELPCAAEADSRSAAGDQCVFPVELAHGSSFRAVKRRCARRSIPVDPRRGNP